MFADHCAVFLSGVMGRLPTSHLRAGAGAPRGHAAPAEGDRDRDQPVGRPLRGRWPVDKWISRGRA